MAKLNLALTAALVASASAFAPSSVPRTATTLKAAEDGVWDPLSLSELGKNIDTFPNMFPDQQFVLEAEIKHGRMAMLAWTGIWATHVVRYFHTNK